MPFLGIITPLISTSLTFVVAASNLKPSAESVFTFNVICVLIISLLQALSPTLQSTAFSTSAASPELKNCTGKAQMLLAAWKRATYSKICDLMENWVCLKIRWPHKSSHWLNICRKPNSSYFVICIFSYMGCARQLTHNLKGLILKHPSGPERKRWGNIGHNWWDYFNLWNV